MPAPVLRPPPTIFETIRVLNGAAPLWHLHIRRMAESCRALGIPVPLSLDVPERGEDRVHRLQVGVAGVQVTTRHVGPTDPIRLAVSPTPHPGYRHKTTDRAVFDNASREAALRGADDAVLLTAGGLVAEGTIWALFWWDGERAVAPALELGVLPSVARARIGELMGGLAEAKVRPADLRDKTLFVANAARGIVPVASFEGVPVPASPRTIALQARFWA